MKKGYIFLGLILAAGVILFLIQAFFPESFFNPSLGLTVTTLVIFVVIAFFLEFESTAKSTKEIALISMLSALSAASRIPFAVIPSLQPSTYIIICSGHVFGPYAGFIVGALTALISNFFLGQGPWTPYQMFAWGLVGASTVLIRKFNLGKKGLITFGFAWGYIFGLIMNLWFWLYFIYPLTPLTFLITQARSFLFDSFHAVGNAFFLYFLGFKTIRILERFKKRFRVEVMN